MSAKRYFVWVVSAVFVLSIVVGCSNSPSSSEKVIKLNMGYTFAPASSQHKGAEHFAKLVKEKTRGQVEIALFSDSQLGADRELGEGMQRGSIDMGIIHLGPLSGFNPKLFIGSIPYVYSNFEQVDKLLFDGGWMGEKMKGYTKEINIITLDFMDRAFRGYSNNKRPVHRMADMKGLKTRVSENAVLIATFKAFGTLPTPMSVAELYSSLQQGTVDAQDNDLLFTEAFRYYEVQKYYTKINHLYIPAAITISKSKWDTLSPEIQKAMLEAAHEASKFQRDLNRKDLNAAEERMKAKGMQIVEVSPEAMQEFVKAGLSIWPQFEGKVEPGIMDKLRAELKTDAKK